MTDDFISYQTSDTAWRYGSRVGRLEDEIANLKQLLATAEAQLLWLREHPPLYEYFNWSA